MKLQKKRMIPLLRRPESQLNSIWDGNLGSGLSGKSKQPATGNLQLLLDQ
jgi:hypothetical protein